MTTNEIKALIEKYSIVEWDGKIGTYAKVDKAAFMRDVPPHKEEIKQYFAEEKKAAQEKYEREMATFEAIPGVKEIREARNQRAAWRAAFNEMMETGASKMDYIEHKSDEEMSVLKAKYPMAVFALEAEYRAAVTENDRLSAIWTDTYNEICQGGDIAKIKADHDARMEEFGRSVIFD